MICRSIFTCRLGVLVPLLFASAVEAQERIEEADLPSLIDGIVAPYVAAHDFMGVIGVERQVGHRIIAPYGLGSIELGSPHEEQNVFMIGSISKQFTAVAVLLLEEDGLLSTGDPAGLHVDELRQLPRLTIHQLLTHTAGVTDIYSLERFGASAGQVATFSEVITDLVEAGLTFEPGSRYAYSNGGYAVLAAIVESVSGLSYGDFLNERLFQPLGLRSTAHDAPGPAIPHRVPGYDPWGPASLQPALPMASSFTTGSGSLWSSAADLLTWTHSLHNGRILSEKSYAKLVTDYGNGYGYGVSVFQRFGRAVVGHDGRVSGYASDVAYYREDDTAVVVLSNVQSVARDEIRTMVAAAVLGSEYDVPAVRRFGRPSGSLAELVGQYSFAPGFVVAVSESSGRLLARANEGGYSELTPLEGSRWFSRMLYATVRFERNAEGIVDRLVWGEADNAPVGLRVD